MVENENELTKVSYFCLSLGFLFSILGAMVVFLSGMYIRSLRHEKIKFALASIKKYSKLFYFGYITLFINSAAFLVPINLLVHELLDFQYAIVINIISVVIFITGVIIYCILMLKRQIFELNNIEYKRRIYE